MAEIKPKIVDGIKYWNIVDNKKFTYTDINGKIWKGKQAFNRKFEEVMKAAYKTALDAKKKLEGKDATLSTREVSNLRKHKDVGFWLIDGEPASTNSVNAFLKGTGRKKVTNLSLSVPKRTNKYFTREFLDSAEFRDQQIKKWTNRLDDAGWPEGTSKKGFIKYIQDSYKQTDEYNKILSKRLGFPFQAGHIWGAMGPVGDRTTIGPLGTFSGGNFTARNVTSQPSAPHIKQLLDKAWNIITPNVPGFFDKRGVQIESAKDLLDTGFGGQGWQGALTDYLTQGGADLDKLDAWDKAYIAFADPSKGDFIGKTVEARKAQILTPGLKDEILRKSADLAATAEELSGPVKIANIFDEGSPTRRMLSNIGETYQKLPTPVKFGTGLLVAGAGLDIHDIHAGGVQAEQEEGDTLESKYRQAAGRLRQTSGALGLGGAGTSIMTNALSSQAIKQGIPLQPKGLSTKIPTTGQLIKGGNLLSSVAGLSSLFTGLTAWRAEHLADQEARRTRDQKIMTGEITPVMPENLEITKTEPRFPALNQF